MKKLILASLFFCAVYTCPSLAQATQENPSFTENTPDTTLFQAYLDTIKQNLYINGETVNKYVKKCEALLATDIVLSDKQQFEYVIQMIYVEVTNGEVLAAFKILKDNKEQSKQINLPRNLRNTFDYMEGYVHMMLDDFEFAQHAYYRLLERGRVNKDTMSILQSMYSLGQLFSFKEDYANAEKFLMDAWDLQKKYPGKKRWQPQTILELIRIYMDGEQYEKATVLTKQGALLLDSLKIVDLKVDFALMKGYLALEQNELKVAWATYLETREMSQQLENPLMQEHCEFLKAAIYMKEGLPERALAIYQFFIGKDAKESLTETRDLLVDAHEASREMGDFALAHQYLSDLEEIKEKIAEEKKMQQTAYLQAKFEAEQKDKENALLAAQVKHEQSQQQFLFALIGLFLLSICFLIGAFIQKRNYNRRLKAEVANRTGELRNSNRELDEFNRILSHDLKEPLRSIVGFSTLASKEVFGNPKAMEYLCYIENSGKQLHQIIEDVSTYQSIECYAEYASEWVNTDQLIEHICHSSEFQMEGKSLRLVKLKLPTIYANRSFLYLIFKNLLENGMKYNEQAEVVIQVEYEKSNGQHLYRFTDNGIGIASAYQEKIFQMFKRLNDRGAYEGSGLGLSIVRKMIEKAGGSVALLASTEGEGSTFELCLPVIGFEEAQPERRRLVEQF